MIAMLSLAVASSTAQTRHTYTVRAGDTLYRIAVNNNLSVQELQTLNGLTGTVIKVGQVLRLTAPGDELDVGPLEDVVAGDSVLAETGAAALSAITPPADSTATANSPTLVVRDSLEADLQMDPPAAVTPVPVSPPSEPAGASSGRIEAVIDSTGAISYGEIQLGPGQSFFDLAFALGVSVDTLRTMNPDHQGVLADRGRVRVPGRFAATSYRVRPGDTLYKIAAEHGISLGKLVLANPGMGDVIQVGQAVRIPSPNSPAETQLPVVIAEGTASVYPSRFAGRLMASGQAYDESRHIIAHPTLSFGTVVMIENADTGGRTFAEVADRMPVSTGFVVEVSRAVADAIALDTGNIRVRIIHSVN